MKLDKNGFFANYWKWFYKGEKDLPKSLCAFTWSFLFALVLGPAMLISLGCDKIYCWVRDRVYIKWYNNKIFDQYKNYHNSEIYIKYHGKHETKYNKDWVSTMARGILIFGISIGIPLILYGIYLIIMFFITGDWIRGGAALFFIFVIWFMFTNQSHKIAIFKNIGKFFEILYKTIEGAIKKACPRITWVE